MKRGVFTSEFYLSIIAVLIQVWMTVENIIPAEVSAWTIAIVTIAWTGFRTIAKITPNTKDDELVKKIEDVLKQKLIP